MLFLFSKFCLSLSALFFTFDLITSQKPRVCLLLSILSSSFFLHLSFYPVLLCLVHTFFPLCRTFSRFSSVSTYKFSCATPCPIILNAVLIVIRCQLVKVDRNTHTHTHTSTSRPSDALCDRSFCCSSS